MMKLKNIFFKLHHFGIYIVNFGWIFSSFFIYLQFIVIFSWIIFNNKCIISDIEIKLFGNNFLNKNNSKVPFNHRLLLYSNFILSLLFLILNFYYCFSNTYYLIKELSCTISQITF